MSTARDQSAITALRPRVTDADVARLDAQDAQTLASAYVSSLNRHETLDMCDVWRELAQARTYFGGWRE